MLLQPRVPVLALGIADRRDEPIEHLPRGQGQLGLVGGEHVLHLAEEGARVSRCAGCSRGGTLAAGSSVHRPEVVAAPAAMAALEDQRPIEHRHHPAPTRGRGGSTVAVK